MIDQITEAEHVTILEVLDRVLNKGIVLSGDIIISVAEVDLIYIGLRLLISSVETMVRLRGDHYYDKEGEAEERGEAG